jgi:hypothetical protein
MKPQKRKTKRGMEIDENERNIKVKLSVKVKLVEPNARLKVQ